MLSSLDAPLVTLSAILTGRDDLVDADTDAEADAEADVALSASRVCASLPPFVGRFALRCT